MTIDNNLDSPGHHHRDSYLAHNNLNDNYQKCFQNYYHGHNYLQPNPNYITNVKSNVNHWQLRDLLQINQNTGDIYFTKSYSIWKLNGDKCDKCDKLCDKLCDKHDDDDKHGDGDIYSYNHNHNYGDHDNLPRGNNRGLNRSNLTSQEIFKPDYSPRCFNITNDNKMVIGGLMTSAYKIFYSNIQGLSVNNQKSSRPQKGLFSFYNNDLQMGKTVKIGEMINNSVSIYANGNHQDTNWSHYNAFICNNDSSLYSIDILNNDKLSVNNKIICEHDVSLNNAARNPINNKNLIVTGDSPSIFLIDPTIKNSKIDTIKTNNDSGFGISFHPNGNIFSTSFQNGNCLIYDLRNVKHHLKEINSTRPGHQSGAFRCCKFSNNALSDLLVILEHVGRVHLIDLRNLNDNNHQVIIFPFALDQFGEYKSSKLQLTSRRDQQDIRKNDDGESSDNLKPNISYHDNLNIYEDESNIKFNAPLVYDYDYLTNINPKLFKYYTYQPSSTKVPQCPTISPMLNNSPTFNHHHGQFASPSSSPTSPILQTFPDPYNMSVDYDGSHTMESYSSDSYQHSDNHIYGEMELSGLDWFDDKLIIGCENGGLFSWDVNHVARRSFGSFSFI